MRLLCCNRIITTFLFLFSLLWGDAKYAFIYSKNIDDRFINFYDKVVVEADAVDNIYALRYPKKMVAYVSVGEIEPWRATETKYNKTWIISKNRTWNSLIADLRKEDYQAFIFKRIAKLYKDGYRNFFLDTMDAYHVTSKDKRLFKKQQKALISFIHKLHKKYPDSKIIINRGFELLEKIHNDIDAVVAESLLNRYNHDKKSYEKVPKKDREWLLTNFKKAKKYGLDVISIEYSDKSTKERLEIAKKVKKLGFISYVTDGLLQEQGECDRKRARRDVLILFNKSLFKDKNAVYSDVHLLASMPLEYWGYVPILYDISTQDLPKRVEDRYHSVIVWSEGKTKNSDKLHAWAKGLQAKDIKILFLNNFVFASTSSNLKAFGLSYVPNKNSFLDKSKTIYGTSYSAYEVPASIEYEEQLLVAKSAKEVVSSLYKNGQKGMNIAVTPWGGYAIDGAFLATIGEENFWTVNPFQLFKDALRLDAIPVPDPTTEAGRRILFVHVDGDGFMEVVRVDPKKLSTEYLIEHIYKKYKIPQTISVIQGEVDTIGLYPKLSSRMKKISRELYRIPWVEPASHTLSHPFFWGQADEEFRKKHLTREQRLLEEKKVSKHAEAHYHLPLPNYHFSLQKETLDSVKFALSLAPKSKQSTRILFWSGDCLPTKMVLAYTERHHILGMNGGDTTIKKSDPWMSHVAPFGLQREEYWQIYTAQQNENVYTHDWLGPFWGYRDAIETFEMTEKPYRLKPINIYYHFYSGSKLASFQALKDVYEWAVKQKTSKLYASQYIKKARGFYRTAISKIEGGYEVRNSGYLRTVRFDRKVAVDIQKSRGVAGFIQHNGSTYITLDSQEKHRIILGDKKNQPYLIDANGWVDRVDVKGSRYRFALKANIAIEAHFYLPQGCHSNRPKGVTLKREKENLLLSSKKHRGVEVVFKCQ